MGSKGSKSGGGDQSATAQPLQANSVQLNVYQPNQSSALGGVYHTGMVLFDTEYSFAQGPSSLSGIQSSRPRVIGDPQWRFRESINLGQTQLSREEVRTLIAEMKNSGEWAGNSYNLTRKNCNHFSEALCAKLGLSIPGWVNRPARMAGALGLGPSAQAQQLDLDGRPLREEDRAALVLTHAQDVCIDALLDRPALGCLGAKPAHSLAAIIPCDAKGNRTQLRPDAVLSSDADEQLLLFLPFTRALRICSLLLRVSSRDSGLGSNPRTLKLYADRRNVDFSDVDEITPTQVVELPSRPADGRAFTKLEQKEGVWELVVPLNMAKFHSCAFLTLFVETNHGAPTTSIHGITVVGRDK